MPTVTITCESEWKQGLKQLAHINWSEIAREEATKKLIFDSYIKRKKNGKLGEVTDEEWKFCERIDWHPVDWLPYKKSYLRKLSGIKRDNAIKVDSVAELFNDL